jgi:hypothetical protein
MGRIVGTKLGESEVVRFWRLVEKTERCWLWRGGFYVTGYGRFAPSQHKQGRAHRYSWELHNGTIPRGLDCCHHCDNRACVRPSHLFLGTRGENMQDCSRKRRTLRGANHPTAMLTWAQAEEVRALWATGTWMQKDLARHFGVGKHVVQRICARTAYVAFPS